MIFNPVALSLLIILRGLALLPWLWLQRLGQWLGIIWSRVPSRQRRDILINMQLCLPQLSTVERLTLCQHSMIQFSCTIVELAAMWLWPMPQVLALITSQTGTELLQLEPKRGLIVLAPHLGSWELAGLYMASNGGITSMYRPQQHLDKLILAARERSGATLVPDDQSGVKRLLRTVLRGGRIGILPDQVTREETGAIFAPFFGVPAVTMLLVAGLARRSGARVVFLFAERLPQGAGFHLHCLPAPPGIDDPDDQIAAAALNKGVEQCIRLCPEQYQWMYRRFRRRPDQQPNPYVESSM